MHPELFTLPGGISIKTYGFCLMIGFLSAVWLAMRRAQRVKANPDTVLDLSFLSLVFGVGCARAFFVVHYWPDFAAASNPLLAIIDIRQGGLEFLGGLIGAIASAVIYLAWRKQSIRLYLDIMAPSVMWGLAFGRIGCFFTGCCFGGTCVVEGTNKPALPWAVQFPFQSPAHIKHWEERQVTVPAELVVTPKGLLRPQPMLVPETNLSMSVERRNGPARRYKDLSEKLEKAKAEAPGDSETVALEELLASAARSAKAHQQELAFLLRAQHYPSRVEPNRVTSVSELEDLAGVACSLPVHPTQIYAAIHAFLLSALLSAVFFLRKRHGLVITLLFMLYPVARFLLEQIRVDNPRDVGGLTISQSISLVMPILGIAFLVYLYKFLPQRSPRAENAAPPKEAA